IIISLYFLAAKYCSLVESEGGLTLLSELLHHEAPPSHVKQLASIVINNCRQYNENDYLETDAQLDG
ncbi:hypothetical protein NL493_30435, partial [Klebsiella pneumoniae]|nr:hypothetical protein [Klebsiella pneumoniae]